MGELHRHPQLIRFAAKLRGLTLVGVLAASSALAQTDPGAQLSASTSFSALDEIGAGNVEHLTGGPVFATGRFGGQAGAPSAAGDLVYIETGFPNAIFALELAQASPSVAWSYAPEPDGRARGLSCCGRTEFGPVLSGAKLYANTLDGRTVALDRRSGNKLWETKLADLSKGETLASPPVVADGKVLVGNAGDEFGARGWIAALDAESGRILWRQFSTGPDAEIGIGASFSPFDPRDRGTDRGVATWPPSAWQHGGGSVSGRIIYDPELRLVFHGTGRAAPWDAQERPGANRWTSGLFARDPETGQARWFVAFGARDPYARGGVAQDVLLDAPWKGSARKLLLHPDGNGFLYVVDRVTGEMLAADPFTHTDASPEPAGPGAVAGPVPSPDENVVVRDICPAWSGATGAGSPAFSPITGLLYLPVSRLCMDFEPRHASYLAGTPFIGANIRVKPPKDGTSGALVAWDVQARKAAWSMNEPFPLAGGVLATAGDLVFYGTLDGMIKARDARDGKLLWSFAASDGIIAQPATFNSSNGHQYLAVMTGLGGGFGMAERNMLDPLDQSAGLGLVAALSRLPTPRERSATLYLFRLP